MEKPMTVVCVGASYPLNERATRTFSNLTIPDIAAIIAREHSLHLIADSHPTVFPSLTIAGHSYWEWLQEQAKRIGFVILVDGTKVSVRPSGTEPKIKFYISVKDQSAKGASMHELQTMKKAGSERLRRIEQTFVSMAQGK
jgi:phosphomannomutase